MKNLKSRVVKEMTRLNIFNDKIPYTHHHEYVRSNIDKLNYSGLSEIAQIIEANEDELYACAFIQAIAGMTDRNKICSKIHIGLYEWCSLIAKEHIKIISEILK